uniref:Ig-like domain-containing protein n=1 Tax=Terrapene triunguis TaxID=2587831 RepID=A0A674JDA0_9SAUR
VSLVSLAQLSRSWIWGKSIQETLPAGPCITELSYPKPNISLRPSVGVALGGAVTVRCECRCPGARVLLYKAGAVGVWRARDSAGDVVEFSIRNVSQRDAGSYSCQYSTKWDPPVWSEPSDPVELVITGEGPGSASLLPAPHPARPSRGGGGALHLWDTQITISAPPPTPMDTGSIPAGGTDSTQPGAAPAPTRPGSTGPRVANPPGLAWRLPDSALIFRCLLKAIWEIVIGYLRN